MRKAVKPKLSIRKKDNETVIIRYNPGNYDHIMIVDVKSMSRWEQIEAIRWEILKMGAVWTRKIEKLVRKELDS